MTRRRVARGIATLAVGLAALLILPAPPCSWAGTAPAAADWPPLRDLVRDVELALEVDGKPVPSEAYRSASAGAFVILAAPFRAPVALRGGVVATLDGVAVERRPDATLAIPAGATVSPRGSFEVAQDGISFTLDGHQVHLRHVRPPDLLGLHSLAEVTAHNPEYLAGAAAYQANEGALRQLAQERRPVTVRIYYGSWCMHCRRVVPHAVYVDQRLAGSAIHFEYLGVGVPATDPEALRAGILQIPTAVVTLRGQEIGRIVLNDAWDAFEVALLHLLERYAPPRAGGGA